MAKCTYKLPEETLKKLSTLGERIDEVSEKALKAGGDIVLKKTKSNLKSVIKSEQSTGELVNSLGLSEVLIDRNGNPNIKIGFAEPRSDGKSNAMIANIIEYGKHNQPARPFLKPAKSATQKECIAKMVEVIEEEARK